MDAYGLCSNECLIWFAHVIDIDGFIKFSKAPGGYIIYIYDIYVYRAHLYYK